MRFLLALILILAVCGTGAVCGCQSPPGGTSALLPPAEGAATPPPATVRFTEIAHQAGIDFVHTNGATPGKRMPETVGSGVAFADFDGDGKLDILIVNSMPWPDKGAGSGGGKPATPHLYRNKGVMNGVPQFEDVTAGSGLDRPMYGMGVAVGDYDGDGKEDVYLTCVGPNHLCHNDGHFHFTEVTRAAGVEGISSPDSPLKWKWSTGAAWLDYDRDGNLDLLVCQYVKWSPTLDPYCGHNGARGYCPPDNFEGARCTLYRGDGNGHFTNVSKEVGLLDGAVGKSFGIAVADFNGDGWPDIVITNDTWANFLFVNEGGKHFSEKGVESGIAFGENGRARAGMGIDIADWRNDGRFGVAIGNFVNEGLSLFETDKGSDLLFTDAGPQVGVALPSLLNVTFATFFLDADLDGWPDLFATNGHVDDSVNTYQSNLTFRQKPLLLRNLQGKRFTDVSADAGFTEKLVGRGAAYGDLDGDGKLDIGIVDNGGRFRLYHNDTTGAGHFIRLHLVGSGKNTDALGALVRVTAGGLTQSQYVKSEVGFLSECERTLTFGLGTATSAEKVSILWPDGKKTEAGPFPAGQTQVITEEKSR